MADVLRIKRRVSGSPGAPASLANAELAYNEVDHTLYIGEGTGGAGGSATVVEAVGGKGTFAKLASPAFTGTPTAPTNPSPADSSTQLATTAWVHSAIGAVSSGVTNITTQDGLSGGGTGAVTIGISSIANTKISGLGTMSTQNAGAVAITGGTIDGVTLDCGTF